MEKNQPMSSKAFRVGRKWKNDGVDEEKARKRNKKRQGEGGVLGKRRLTYDLKEVTSFHSNFLRDVSIT